MLYSIGMRGDSPPNNEKVFLSFTSNNLFSLRSNSLIFFLL